VVTSILGPMLTEYYGRQRLAERDATAGDGVSLPQTANQVV
jgi:hypothetical protein